MMKITRSRQNSNPRKSERKRIERSESWNASVAGTESFSIDPRPRYRSPLAGGWSGGARRRKLARWNLRLRPIPRRKMEEASMRFYSAAPYRGHLSAGICFCLSAGAVRGGGRRHRKYDGRTTMGSRRRWNKRAPPKISSAEPLLGLRGDLRADGATPVRLRIDIPGCANKRNPGGGGRRAALPPFLFLPLFPFPSQ